MNLGGIWPTPIAIVVGGLEVELPAHFQAGRQRAASKMPALQSQRRGPDRAPGSGLQWQWRAFPADDRRGRQRRLPGIRVPLRSANQIMNGPPPERAATDEDAPITAVPVDRGLTRKRSLTL